MWLEDAGRYGRPGRHPVEDHPWNTKPELFENLDDCKNVDLVGKLRPQPGGQLGCAENGLSVASTRDCSGDLDESKILKKSIKKLKSKERMNCMTG